MHEREAQLLCTALGIGKRHEAPLKRRLSALGGLPGLCSARSEGLEALLSPKVRERLDAVLTLFDRMVSAPLPPVQIDGADAVAAYFRTRLALCATESFWVLMLDARGRVIGEECVSVGTLTACLVHPREIYAPALRARAAQVIVVHNHPSGDPTPSDEDVALTERLSEAGSLIGIPLLDHVVVARRGHRSLGSVQRLTFE
jgi:DNA repair protein RadC